MDGSIQTGAVRSSKATVIRSLIAVTAAIALIAMMVGSIAVRATHVEPELRSGNPTCADLVTGQSGEFVLDAQHFGADGTYGDAEFSVFIEFTFDNGEAVSFDFSDADPLVLAVFVKGGPGGNLYEYNPPTDADEGLVAPPGPQGQVTGISHISFCYVVVVETPTPTPTDEPTPTPTDEPTPTPTDEPTPTPTDEPTPTPTDEPSPALTPPPTGALPPTSGPEGPTAMWLALLVGALAAAWLLLRPPMKARARVRNR